LVFSGIKDLTLIPIWTNPEEVKKESRKLSAMFQAVQSNWEYTVRTIKKLVF